MFDFITYGADKLQLFLLVMLRASGVFLFAPILGHKSVPAFAKVGLIVLFSIILVTAMGDVSIPKIGSLVELAGFAFKEIFVGVIIGFVFLMILLALQGAGSIVGYQIGLYLANILDPATHTQTSIIGQIWFLLGMLIFLTINGHHMVISALADSYRVIPAGYVTLDGGVGEMMIKYTAYLFVIALKIASPVLITAFLTDVALGTLAKMMPSMNVFFVGFPVKIGVGLMVIAMSLPVFAYVLTKTMAYLDGELHLLFLTMGKA